MLTSLLAHVGSGAASDVGSAKQSRSNATITLSAADWEQIKSIWTEWDERLEDLHRRDAEDEAELASLRSELDVLRNGNIANRMDRSTSMLLNTTGVIMHGLLTRGVSQLATFASLLSADPAGTPMAASENLRDIFVYVAFGILCVFLVVLIVLNCIDSHTRHQAAFLQVDEQPLPMPPPRLLHADRRALPLKPGRAART